MLSNQDEIPPFIALIQYDYYDCRETLINVSLRVVPVQVELKMCKVFDEEDGHRYIACANIIILFNISVLYNMIRHASLRQS